MASILYVVATPIGNLQDLTFRALEVLKAVDFVICEDTRHSGKLLSHFGISKETLSMPAFDESARVERLSERISQSVSVAWVTDAGTPGISDPGQRLVSACVEKGVSVIPIPGVSAVTAALSVSGLSAARFHFLGFLPRQKSEMESVIGEVRALNCALVIYEAPGRVRETLSVLLECLGARQCVVARELTKIHEEVLRGRIGDVVAQLAEEPRGEFVIVIDAPNAAEKWSEAQVESALREGLARKERLKPLSQDIAKMSQWSASDVYAMGVKLKMGPSTSSG